MFYLREKVCVSVRVSVGAFVEGFLRRNLHFELKKNGKYMN